VNVRINELLSYASYYRDRAAHVSIHKAVTGFCTSSEISVAKKLLVSAFSDDLADCPLKAERRKSTTREVHEAEVEDILGLFN